MTPVSVSPKEKSRESFLSLVQDHSRIAGRFLAARRAAAGLDVYPGDFPATLDEAYAIQDEAIARWGRPVIGWKVGRVPPQLIDRFGTDRLAGPIFARIAEKAARYLDLQPQEEVGKPSAPGRMASTNATRR